MILTYFRRFLKSDENYDPRILNSFNREIEAQRIIACKGSRNFIVDNTNSRVQSLDSNASSVELNNRYVLHSILIKLLIL